MDIIINFPYWSIFLCMVSAILLSIVKNARVSFYWTLTVSVVSAILSFVFFVHIFRLNEFVPFTMGKFPAPFGNEIRVGPLQGLLAGVFSLVMAMSQLGGMKDLFEDVKNSKMGLACVMLNMTLASLLVLVYTNDIFTAYVFIEISTIAACALVMIKENGETLTATIRYLFMSLLGSGLFLFGIIILYGITGHLLIPQMTEEIQKLFATGKYYVPLVTSAAMIVAGLGIKSAMFPFHRWLPGAHGSATTTASAVLSGLVLKGYAVLLITVFIRVFGLEIINAISINLVVLFFGFLGMIVGSVYAIREGHSKRMLAYSSVAQLGYVFMGIGLGTEAGIAAAIFQIIAHACTKPLLFASVGRLSVSVHHNKEWKNLHGTAYTAPLAGIGFTVGGLSMIGIPLFAGFTSKVNFAVASFENMWQTIAVVFVLVLSGLLNALYYVPAILNIWAQDNRGQLHKPAKDPAFGIAAVVFIICIFALGIFFAPVMASIETGLGLMM